jgi:uncharacterized protein (DUF1330 family)
MPVYVIADIKITNKAWVPDYAAAGARNGARPGGRDV